jgi:hypothetical protein
VRLFTLLLTLSILGLGGYFAGCSPFRQEWADVYWISLTALGTVSGTSTFFLGQILSRFEKLTEFPLDSLQQEAFKRKLSKRRKRLLIKWSLGLFSGISAIALGNALKITKAPVVAGLGTASITVSLVCFVLLVIEFIALSNLLDRLKEQTERRKKKQTFLTGSEV